MTEEHPKPVTQMLLAASRGDAAAVEQLWRTIYQELHDLAGRQMRRERPGHTLQTTALIHEVYVRLIGDEPVEWANRRQFFGAAAQAMCRIRIDAARHRQRAKRGGGRQRMALDAVEPAFDDDPAELLGIDEALRRLERVDPRQAEVVRLRFFAGLSVSEVAAAMALSPRSVERDWRFAKAWLRRELSK